ncbi:MAG: hypothetical protein KDC70_03225 [Saprospiraceae bacterium]|nr:hypothetical protein [Saprospiraceae bacterium]
MKKTIRIHIHAMPTYTPTEATLYLAGNVNNWQPADAAFRFKPNSDGSYSLEFQTDVDTLEFKITRGDWQNAEGGANGTESPNRIFKPGPGDNELWLRIESWTDLRHEAGQKAVSENVLLLHDAFEIPQLGRRRRIWAILPPDYRSTEKRYPVVYMQDGQNLFDNPAAIFGSWGIDQALNRLFLQNSDNAAGMQARPILIGIENGGAHRISEYSPWQHPEHGGGEGAAYLDFICQTLKPFVDARLRTLPGREHTGIMGSSMGGLFSMYAALERPDRFGMAGIFSPSLWFSKDILPYVKARRPEHLQKILLMAGQQESKSMVGDLLDLYETLLEAGHDDRDLHYDLHADGVHAEWFWAREFEHALRWLFGEMPGHTHGISDEYIRFRLDESSKHLVVRVDPRLRQPLLEVRDYCHYREIRHTLENEETRIPYAAWEDCLYSIRLLSGDDLVFSRRVHLSQVTAYTPPAGKTSRHRKQTLQS